MQRPISVVGSDQEALRALLALHAAPEPRILDVTHNRGVMWKGLPYTPHRSDSEPSLHAQGFTDSVADFRQLPFESASWDVIVFDPPHMCDAGRSGLVGERNHGGWAGRYGTLSDGFKGHSIAPMFEPFLRESKRVLVPGGIVLAKIANQVHSGRYQDQARALKNAAETQGFTHCDEMVRVSMARAGLIDPRWRRICHVRAVHTFWICLRSGPECISPSAPTVERAPETTPMFGSAV